MPGMKTISGVIALDIDGTLTARDHLIPAVVVRHLNELARDGWQLLFVTGRTFSSAYGILKDFRFPYYFSVQNGAMTLLMPEGRIIAKKYLDRSIFLAMDAVCREEATDYVVFGGYENKDDCYYRPKRFSTELLHFIEKRIYFFKETWYPLDSYDSLPIVDFPSIKCFGTYEPAKRLCQKIEEKLNLHVPLIRDPFDQTYFVVQATYPNINKGSAVKDILSRMQWTGPIIAAGDDNNDLPMFDVAHIKIAMATAPAEVLARADIIAPASDEQGIIKGLEIAIERFKKD